MVVAPDVFGDVERQPLSANPTFRRQAALEVAPETLQAINVRPVSTDELALVMLHQAMDIPIGGNASIDAQGVRADHRARWRMQPL